MAVAKPKRGEKFTASCKNCVGLFEYKYYYESEHFCSDDCKAEGGLYKCERCGEYLRRPNTGVARFCDVCVGKSYEDYAPIKKKAWSLGANIIGGKGKSEWMIALITAALNEPCPYCGKALVLDNISLDHKEPYNSTSSRKNKAENKELRAHLDRRENLHLVCRRCNGLKGNMSHDEYTQLQGFLADKPELATKIYNRFAQAIVMWGNRRGK